LKPLIFIPSPRDIPEFIDSVKLLTKYDKFWVKHDAETTAYAKGRKFFLSSEKNYTHFVILPDDLIVTQDHIEQLIEDIKQNDYQIISGITNIDSKPIHYGKYCVAKELPPLDDLTLDSYNWMDESYRDRWLRMYEEPIIQMKHIGFPLVFIRRDVIETLEFRLQPRYTSCMDLQFCIDCDNLGIPIFVDLRVVGHHLKKADGVYDYWGLATKNIISKFEEANPSESPTIP